MDDPLQISFILILIIIFTGINAFFSAAEMAAVSIRKEKIQKDLDAGNKAAEILVGFTKEPTNFFSAIQLCITLTGFFSSALAGSRLALPLVNLFSKMNVNLSETLAVIFVTLLLTYLSLIFGELIPKRLALRNPEKVALRSAKIIRAIMVVSSPFIKLLSGSTNLVLRIFGIKRLTEEEKISEEQIKSMIIAGHMEGLIAESEKEMLDSIFKFDDLEAESIMTPRTNVFAIDVNENINEVLKKIIEVGYSRIPVYKGDIDNIIGILNIKDLLPFFGNEKYQDLKLSKIIREAYFVPSYIKINILFKNMKETNNQIAVLIDEYGGSVGIVTIEDLVEEIVGNIYDEYDLKDNSIQELEANKFLVVASIQIQELNRRLKINIEENSAEYDTLNGFIIYLLGFIPDEKYKDEIEYNNLILKINKMGNNKIERVLITIKEIVNTEEEEQ